MILTMAVYDTPENGRTEMTRRTLLSLGKTVDWTRHRLVVSDNGSCQATHRLYFEMAGVGVPFELIHNGSNIGTARAINRGWKMRKPGEHALKLDNDCEIKSSGWADELEEVFRRDPTMGICGLKRKDLEERPDHEIEWYRSQLLMLPHQPGERWIVVERCRHIMGTCQAYSSTLLDKIGYLYQMGGLYGFDDALASLRADIAGFKTVFLPHIEIEHIDPGITAYSQWKRDYAGQQMKLFESTKADYRTGVASIYYDGGPDISH
jgi:GT2 family glycosyltransferase